MLTGVFTPGGYEQMERIREMSPRLLARMAGVFYVLEGLTSVFGQLIVPGRLVVSAAAAVTAANILGNVSLFRLGLAASLLAVAFHIVQTLLFYDLFKPVSTRVSLLLVFFSLVAIALQAVSSLFQLPALVVLRHGGALGAFSAEQLQSLALVFLRWREQAFNVFLVFFGFRCALIGYLIYRSTFLPRIIGVLMAFAGLGYLMLLWPPLVDYVAPFNLVLAAPGELSLVAWLLVVGVNVERWNEQARAARDWGSQRAMREREGD
jgi:Domain of unknown function (DUF4386)